MKARRFARKRINSVEAADFLKAAIADEIDMALERLGAPVELRSIVGSYGDTLDDKEVLELMKSYNATGKVLHERQ
jgi:hypothetical protein